MPAQPSDEWTYLRPEEFADDDEVERIGAALDIGAEDAALHPVDPDEPPAGPNGLDPGQTSTRTKPADLPTTTYFDDEEADEEFDTAPHRNDEELTLEPRVDEILASQHYTFDQDGQ